MKKALCILLAAAGLFAGVQANAQMSIGAGYLNSSQKFENLKVGGNGAYAGFTFNLPVNSWFGIAPGLYYTFNGYAQSAAAGLIKGNVTEHSLNVPVNFNFGGDFSSDMRGFIFAGPTFQFGLASTTKADVAGLVESKTDNFKNGDAKRFGVYLGGGVGMDIADRFRVTVGYDHSVTNLAGDSAGYKFSRGFVKLGVAVIL